MWWLIGFVLNKLIEPKSHIAFWSIYALSSVGVIYLFFQFAKLMTWRDERRKRRERCPHGIEGGRAQSKCEVCKAEEAENRGKTEEKSRRAEAIRKIESDAQTLRFNEHVRLCKLRIHELDYLLSLPPDEFEGAVAAMYRSFGFAVKQTPASNDFGRDLIMVKDGKTTFVECKRYARDKLIGRPALQKFYAAIATMKAQAGVVVTTSGFASTAEKFASENGIELVDGPKLVELMARAFPKTAEADSYRTMCRKCADVVTFDLKSEVVELICRNGHGVTKDLSEDLLSVKLIDESPRCSRCGRSMRLVNGGRGTFWGCTGYPACRCTKSFGINSVMAPTVAAPRAVATSPNKD